MAAYVKFYSFIKAAYEKKHNLASDTLKIMLTNSLPSQSNTVKGDLTEISAGGGYTAGGSTVTGVVSSQTLGVYKIVGDDVVFTGSGGGFGPFRYAVLYNDTASNDELICFWDAGSNITLAAGQTFTVDLSALNGIFQDS